MLYQNLTEQQKRDMIVSDLEKNMFVEAGAGAGKTTLIVERIINQLKQGYLPREIVAITFTNAATHELKERIISKAHEVSLTGNLSETEKKNLDEALETIDQMQISTIHSFCNRLLKESSLTAGLPMGMRVIEEDEVKKLKERSFTQWAEKLKREDWEKLLEAGGYRSTALAYLKSLTEQMISVPKDTEISIWYDDVSRADFEKGTQEFVDEFSRNARENILQMYGTLYASLEEIPRECLTKYGADVKAAFIAGERYEIVTAISKFPATKAFFAKVPALTSIKESMAGKESEKETAKAKNERAKKIQEEYKAAEDRFLDDTMRNFSKIIPLAAGVENAKYRPYVVLAQDAAKYFYDRLDAAILTNDLLVQKTYEVLSGDQETAQYLGNKFKCIYVDEFQDTDHIQDAFIRLLVQDAADPDKIRDGALFVVGDPKQSIYRFRGAEPEVYFTAKERMSGCDNTAVLELNDNYRSNPEIIEWVNQNFAQKNITPGTAYAPMNAGKQVPEELNRENVIHGVYFNKNSEEEEPVPVKDDIRAVTNLILNLVGGEYQIIDYDENRQAYLRKIRFSDFLILCAGMRGMNDYANALKAHGIPLVMDSKTILGGEFYMQNFLRLYRLLVNPYSYINRVAAEEALKRTGMTEEEAGRLTQQLIDASKEMSDVAKLKFLQENWLFVLTKNKALDTSELLSVQTRITQMVENVLFTAPGNGVAMEEAMSAYLEKEVEHELVLDDKADAVRFMNLHKAKGLEGNIVIWTNRQEKRGYRAGSIREGRRYYPVVKLGNGAAIWGGYNRAGELIDSAKEADFAENIRLEYVACTRAKQALIFMDKCGKDPVLFEEGYDFGKRSVKEIIAQKDHEIVEIVGQEFTVSMHGGTDPGVHCEEGQPVMRSESPSDFEEESAGKDGKIKAAGSGIKRPSGNIFGLVMHRAFELMVERLGGMQETGDHSERLLKCCCVQAVNENIEDIPSEELEDYQLFVQAIIKAFYEQYWEKQKMSEKAEALYTEMPFTYICKDEEDGRSLIWRHGSADLVMKLHDGTYQVIDYKSDSDESYIDEESFRNRLLGKYTEQVRRYKEAVNKAFGVEEDDVKACLVSFSQKDLKDGEAVRVRVTEVAV